MLTESYEVPSPGSLVHMYEKAEIQFNARTHACKTVIVSKQKCRNRL